MVPARVAIMSSKTPIHQNSEGVTVEGSIVGSGLKRELKQPAQPKARRVWPARPTRTNPNKATKKFRPGGETVKTRLDCAIAGDGVSLAAAGKLRLKQSLQTRSPSNCSRRHERACLTKHPQSIMHSLYYRSGAERRPSQRPATRLSASVF